MVLSGSSINFGHEAQKKSHMHHVGCNELGVGRSLKLLHLQLCFFWSNTVSESATSEWQRNVGMRK